MPFEQSNYDYIKTHIEKAFSDAKTDAALRGRLVDALAGEEGKNNQALKSALDAALQSEGGYEDKRDKLAEINPLYEIVVPSFRDQEKYKNEMEYASLAGNAQLLLSAAKNQPVMILSSASGVVKFPDKADVESLKITQEFVEFDKPPVYRFEESLWKMENGCPEVTPVNISPAVPFASRVIFVSGGKERPLQMAEQYTSKVFDKLFAMPGDSPEEVEILNMPLKLGMPNIPVLKEAMNAVFGIVDPITNKRLKDWQASCINQKTSELPDSPLNTPAVSDSGKDGRERG